MDQLLPYYEQELGFLRRHSREFSERYPRIAGKLLIGGEVCEDPHIERMIESFALLNSRIAKRLDDDYPEFTEALLDVLYPHYLRPFPSCSIARASRPARSTRSPAPTRPAPCVATRPRTTCPSPASPTQPLGRRWNATPRRCWPSTA